MPPSQMSDRVCYVLVNHLPEGRPPVLLGLFTDPQSAIDAFAQNFELKRVEGRQHIRFFMAERPSLWRVYEVQMNAAYALGMLQRAYSIGLEADVLHRVGQVVCEPSQKEKDAAKAAAEAADQR